MSLATAKVLRLHLRRLTDVSLAVFDQALRYPDRCGVISQTNGSSCAQQIRPFLSYGDNTL